MYGDPMPLVVAVDPRLLDEPGSLRTVVWGLQERLRRRSLWAVVGAASSLRKPRRRERMRHLADDPGWQPKAATPVEATAAVLERVLVQSGLRLRRAMRQEAAGMPRPAGALFLAGTQGLPDDPLDAAVRLAWEGGAEEVLLWSRAPPQPASWMPPGLTLRVEDPDPLRARAMVD